MFSSNVVRSAGVIHQEDMQLSITSRVTICCNTRDWRDILHAVWRTIRKLFRMTSEFGKVLLGSDWRTENFSLSSLRCGVRKSRKLQMYKFQWVLKMQHNFSPRICGFITAFLFFYFSDVRNCLIQ
jgi:hypothetical protein